MRPSLPLAVLGLLCAAVTASHADQLRPAKAPELKILKNQLVEVGDFYAVKGTIYNPNARAVKNVIIGYYIWKKWQGQPGHGSIIRDTGGLVQAAISFIAPGHSADFRAFSPNAPVLRVESGVKPDQLQAVISADWAE